MGQDIGVTRIGRVDLHRVWKRLEPFVEKALSFADGQMNSADVRDRVLRDEAQIWLVCEMKEEKLLGVATTEVVKYPRKSVLRVMTLHGKGLGKWGKHLDEALCEFAREHKLTEIEALGRPGLGKLLQQFGYRPAYIAMSKKVEGGT